VATGLTLGQLSNPGYVVSSLPACANSKIVVVAIPKPSMPLGDASDYHPISLLSVPFKILERLIYVRVEPIIEPLLPQVQVGFRHGRSTIH